MWPRSNSVPACNAWPKGAIWPGVAFKSPAMTVGTRGQHATSPSTAWTSAAVRSKSAWDSGEVHP
eukprot:2632608-Alexandrium_andersonii.AAC.1